MRGPNRYVVERLKMARTIADWLAQVPGVSSLAVIGSVATGRAGPSSDIDIVATRGDGFDADQWERACDEIGRDRSAVVASSNPEISTARLRVRGIVIELMLGPESVLAESARSASTLEEEHYRKAFESYAVAVVLTDPKGLWPPVIAAIRAAARRLGIE